MIKFIAAAAFVAASAPLSPSEEARARALDSEIRCVQCVNEPISQSTASIAGDMRTLVRERIAAGDSDADIRGFFADRYGDQVLFRPPMRQETWLLWLSPLILVALGGALIAPLLARRRADPAPLEPEADER